MMNRFPVMFVLSLSISFLAFLAPSFAQSLPGNLTNINIDELSDGQVQQMLQQAAAKGISDDQLIQMARQRGMTDIEIVKLQARLKKISNGRFVTTNTNRSGNDSTNRRQLNFQPDSIAKQNRDDVFGAVIPKIFGAEIFANSINSFSPNLKLATPVNYILGPEDQLTINIYGNSLINWKLDVTPEGNINIPGVGLLNVAGKSVEQATAEIRRRLIANHYAIGRGTSLQVSLGNIRSINVIMIGELKRPGSYTLPSLSSAFNALYAAGGPNENGSFRLIEIIRNNRIIKTLDIYDFLTKGDQQNNVGLQDQDIIRVPSYRNRVQLSGQVKNPAYFEMLPGETLSDLLRFSGGFTNKAFTAKIKVIQIAEQQKKIADVIERDFTNYIPLNGDSYIVEPILQRFVNRVVIKGAVFRPGDYALESGLTLSGLVKKASGIKEDAFSSRISVYRLKPDNNREFVAVDLRKIINNQAPDLVLRREDSIYVSSIFDLRDKYRISIKGEVRKPGEFPFAEGLTVNDMIVRAGGFTEAATGKRIEVSRRIDNSDPSNIQGQIAQVFSLDLDKNLNVAATGFELQPYDIISVYALPGYEKQRVVRIEGEVRYPGYYTLKEKNEKISDIIIRAGNPTAVADPSGGSLRRNNDAILGIGKGGVDSTLIQQERLAKINRLKNNFRDSSLVKDSVQFRNNYIGIDMSEIIKKPGSRTDLILEDGDVIRIPKQQQIVKVNGEVLYPSAIVYQKGQSFNDFVSNAGGYGPQALKRGAYIVYPNGTVKGTRKFLFFNSHPVVKPGSEIYIPRKPEKRGNSTQELLGITTALASLGAIILGIITIKR